jgi:hypothetical protein
MVNVPNAGVPITGALAMARDWYQFFTESKRDIDGKFPISPSSAEIAAMLTTLGIVPGSYTPTLTGVSNVAASTASVSYYVRVDNIVIVFGALTIDATLGGGTTTQLGQTLPVASAISDGSQLRGVAVSYSTNTAVEIFGDATNDRANWLYASTTTANIGFSYIFGYVVL